MNLIAFASAATVVEEPTDDVGSIALDPNCAFVTSPVVRQITERAFAYLEIGYAVHFYGSVPPAWKRRRWPSVSLRSSLDTPFSCTAITNSAVRI
jgi:hypothetical protein